MTPYRVIATPDAKFSVAAAYDAGADKFDSWVWQSLWRELDRPWLRRNLADARRVVVLGVGTGANLDLFEGNDLIGVDVSSSMLSRARDRSPSAKFHCVDARATSLPRGCADLVICMRMLSHVPDPSLVVREARRLLAPSGRMLLSDVHPLHRYGATRLPTLRGHVEVPTWKHDPADLLALGWRVQAFETIRADGLTRWRSLVAGAGATDRPVMWRLCAEAV